MSLAGTAFAKIFTTLDSRTACSFQAQRTSGPGKIVGFLARISRRAGQAWQGLFLNAKQLQEGSQRCEPLARDTFATWGTEDGEGNVIGNHFLWQDRISSRVSRRFPEAHAARLEAEPLELRQVLIQVNEHLASISHRIERPRRNANMKYVVAGVSLEFSALGHYRKASINETLGDRRPVLEEGRRA